jgi:hypothetical protein
LIGSQTRAFVAHPIARPGSASFCLMHVTRLSVLDDKIAVSDDRGVTHIDDLQDHRRAPAGLEPE